jgi:23S rRNA maturation-related 3'-5' exoribonuclease YhaM
VSDRSQATMQETNLLMKKILHQIQQTEFSIKVERLQTIASGIIPETQKWFKVQKILVYYTT